MAILLRNISWGGSTISETVFVWIRKRIARGAEGNPWIFKQILHYFETGERLEKPDFQEVVDMVLRHARLQIEFKGEYTGMREMRKHAAWYTAGYKNSAKLRAKVCEIENYDQLKALFDEVLAYNNK